MKQFWSFSGTYHSLFLHFLLTSTLICPEKKKNPSGPTFAKLVGKSIKAAVAPGNMVLSAEDTKRVMISASTGVASSV